MAELDEKDVAPERETDLPIPDILAVLPLKDVVVFPYIILPLSVSREKSINAVDAALAEQRIIMLVAQKDGQNDTPRPDELYSVGTVAAIMRMLKLPDGRIRLLVQGLSRARIDSFLAEEPYLKAKITRLEESETPEELPPEHEALLRSVKQNLEKSVSLGKNISPEVMVIAGNLDDPARLADLAASNLDLKLEDAQKILESTDAIERLRLVNDSLAKEITVLTMQQEISTQARGEMDKSQREYYLRQQLRAIQQELGEGEEISEELDGYRKIIADKKIPQEAAAEIEKQIKRLERSHPDSAETAIIRTYLDWMTGLPWSVSSEDSKDIDRARRILDEDHYDIEKVKERILEFLAVHALKQSLKGPILCFVGPSGRRKDLPRPVHRPRSRPQVRAPLARRRPRRGRDPRPPAHVRRRDARPDHPGHPPGRDLEPRLHARRDRQDRRRLPGRSRPRRCSRSSTRSRTSRSATITCRFRTTCPGSCSSRRRTCSIRSSRRFSTAWRSSGSRATRPKRRKRSRAGTSFPSRWKRTGSARRTSSSPTAESRRSSRPTRARPDCATSSARSARSAARSRSRWPRGSSGGTA